MKEKDVTVLIEFLGDSPLVRILDFLIGNLPLDAPKEEIIRKTGVSRTSFFAIWQRVEEYGLVKRTRKVGKSAMFALDTRSEIAQQLMKLELELIRKSSPISIAAHRQRNVRQRFSKRS